MADLKIGKRSNRGLKPACGGADIPTESVIGKTIEADVVRFNTKQAVQSTADVSQTKFGNDNEIKLKDDLKPGDCLLGFVLVELLGRGAFADAYLAEQHALAGRHVVLKITKRQTLEPERLGRLQHPNVVPIYSVHVAPPYELICMPFLGRRTLKDVIISDQKQKDPTVSTKLFRAGNDSLSRVSDDNDELPTLVSPSKPKVESIACKDVESPLSSERGILQILADLAAGLDHAHRRGILHLDIKPANVLLTDSGEPMLFDFNLSHDTTADFRERVGGTISYMAPEQIEEIVSRGRGKIDERTDLFALGALGYELFTSEQAFPIKWFSINRLPELLEHRRKTVPSIRDKNVNISPAVDSIIQKLLAPIPADRYQTALQLKNDLDRQLANLPLVSAPNRSIVERLAKWRRRNPRFGIQLATALSLGLSIGFGITVDRHLAADRYLTAVEQARSLRSQLPILRLDLTALGDLTARARGRASSEDLLSKYGVLVDPRWQTWPSFTGIPFEQRALLLTDLGELLLLSAHASMHDTQSVSEEARFALAKEAMRRNRIAEQCWEKGSVPTFLYHQRTELAKLTKETIETAPASEPQDARSHYLEAVRMTTSGKFRTAVPYLEQAIGQDPAHAAAHFALAYCRQQLGQYARALERYDTAQALLTSDSRPAFNRGLVFGLQKKHKQAEVEFTLAIQIDPSHGESYRNRAVARHRQGNLREAEADLTAALERNVSVFQIYHLRGQIRTQLGDHRGAECDRRDVGTYLPRDEADFLIRGRSQLPKDPAAALEDFEEAERLNPRSLAALQNQAHVHSEYRKDTKKSLEIISRAVELFPEYAPARAGRAVLLARSGNREEAHREAEAALGLSDDPMIAYQLAGVYAHTSVAKPVDADRAFALLRQSIRDGFREPALLESDADLATIKKRDEFTALLNALKNLSRP